MNTYLRLDSHQLLWEILKVNIKEFSIHYCKAKAKILIDNCNDMQLELDTINKDISHCMMQNTLDNADRNSLQSLYLRKEELEII